ncbi:MAG: NAD-dependent DNA ligase LigA [Bacteroidota bacterium]
MILKSDALKRINILREEIREHNFNYYTLADPKISDLEFDKLLQELISLENNFPEFFSEDSPTQRVGGDPTKEFATVIHDSPMLSLDNTYSHQELRDFDKRIKKLLGDNSYQFVCELKIDGVALSLKYKNGKLQLAATRGNGTEGDEITNNVRTIRTIPLKVRKSNFKIIDFEVRGEAFMMKKDFSEMNKERESIGEKLFANPRNSTAGTLKLQDPKLVSMRPLNVFLYFLRTNNFQIKSHSESLKILNDLRFFVNPNYKICKTIDDVIDFCSFWQNKRETLPYEIDGVVVKIDSLNQQEILGQIAKSPRWATAFKFPAKKIFTKLNEITLQVGRLGTITPVAELKSVHLAGSTISRATLHNEDFIRELDIRIGDTIQIEKGGDVIPKVIAVDISKRPSGTKIFRMPKDCPECKNVIYKKEGEAAYYCKNINCPAQVRGRIEHFAHRGAMDIDGLGEAIVSQLVNEKLISTIADIYDLSLEKLAPLERMGIKSAQNLLKGINESKSRALWKLIFGLGIRNVGAGVAKLLANNFGSIDKLTITTVDELIKINGVGQQIAESIVEYFQDPQSIHKSKNIIVRLKLAGIKMNEVVSIKNNFLQNKTFVVTGTLSSMSREEAIKEIESLGGKVSSSVSAKTNFLVVGAEPGSKIEKANKFGVKILDEKSFITFLRKE